MPVPLDTALEVCDIPKNATYSHPILL